MHNRVIAEHTRARMAMAHNGKPGTSAADAERDAAAWEALYQELKALARRKLAAESAADLLQPTALVHEAWLRLAGQQVDWADRSRFLRLAARVMRHVLVDQARALKGRQRDPGALRVTLDSRIPGSEPIASTRLLDIDAALERLAAENERCAQALELHYFGGMTYAEIAATLDTSEVTVKRDLRSGRAWLLSEMEP